MSDLLERITVNPQVCRGMPRIRGTRILACLVVAAELIRERLLPVDVAP